MRNMIIIFDEMKVKADLVYSKATGEMVGFTEMGSINEQMLIFADRAKGASPLEKEFPKYVRFEEYSRSCHTRFATMDL